MEIGLSEIGGICDISVMSQCHKGPPITPEQLDRLPVEVQGLVCEIIDYYEARIADLEDRLGKNPQNSSLPPSSQHPHAKPKVDRKPSGRKRGGQPGHQKHERCLVPTEDCNRVHPLWPTHCRRCGETLSGDDSQPLRHQVWELPEIQPIITEYQQHRLICPCCSASTTAVLPDGVPTGQTGPQLTAFTALLMAYFRQSKRRTALFLAALLNTPCSIGLTVKLQKIATAALRPCYEQLERLLPACESVGMDETPMKEGGKKSYLWTAVTADFTLFALRDSRKADVPQQLLGEDFCGVVTSDRYAGYDWITLRQLCWEHLKRDFQSLVDAGGKAKAIGKRLRESARQLFHCWHRYRDGTITRRTMKQRIKQQLWWSVYEALEEGTITLRGKQAGMCQHILDRFDSLWTFLDHESVEPTNNASERSLRHAVIWRKLSFGTQSASGSRFVETMLSVIETARQQNRNVFAFVTRAVEARFAHRPTPLLLADP